jgi:predicted GNAT superfamily acetyltransferase
MNLRSIEARDLARVLALNNEHAAEVNELAADALERLVRVAAFTRIVDDGVAFLVALNEKTPIQGPNHGFYVRRYAAFSYIDRVVVSAQARGRGIARRLYEDLAASSPERLLCCEVNVEPPNPGSLVFHEKLGFQPCGEEALDPRNGKRVRYFFRDAIGT